MVHYIVKSHFLTF